MKNFRYDALWLLSEKTTKARRLLWSKERNAVVGTNHTGKSTVLRMIFEAFGCKTRPLGDEWDARTVVLLRFSLDDINYFILRQASLFALFNADHRLAWATEDSGEVREHLSHLFKFVLPLAAQSGDSKQARPAFFFMPTFIDQDGSWGSRWDTFLNVGEYKDWQKATIELALGIRTSEYWQAVSDFSSARDRAAEIDAQILALTGARKRLETSFPRVHWFRDALSFRSDLRELEERAGQLAREQDELRNECTEAAATREALQAQIYLVESALLAHVGDMRFLDTRQIGENINCPTCGTSHEHSFFERLNLEAEADELRQMRGILLGQTTRAEKVRLQKEDKLKTIQRQSDEMNEILNRTRGDLRLRQIIDHAGVGKAHDAFDDEVRMMSDSRAARARHTKSPQ